MARAFGLFTCAVVLTPALLAMSQQVYVETNASPLRDLQSQQESLQQQITQLATRLDEVSAEFSRNGLAELPEARAVNQTRQALTQLVSQQMGQVVVELEMARSNEPVEAERHLADARTLQASILAELDRIIRQYTRQQALARLADQFAALAQRQLADLRLCAQLQAESQARGSIAPGVTALATEQASLRGDINSALADLAGALPEGSDEASALADQIQLPASSLLAAQGALASDLSTHRLYDATDRQLQSYRNLLALARTVQTPMNRLLRLESVQTDLADAEAVMAQTSAPAATAIDKNEALFTLGVESDRLAGALASDCAPAADSLKQSLTANEMSRLQAALNRADLAAQSQDESQKLLKQAADQVADAIEQAKRDSKQSPQDNLARLNDLTGRLTKLADQQQANHWASAANSQLREAAEHKEAALSQQAADIEQELGPMANSAASSALGKARAKMNQAAARLNSGSIVDQHAADDAEASALASVREAAGAVQEQEKTLQAEQKQDAVVAEAQKTLSQNIEAQQTIYAATAAVAAQKPSSAEQAKKVSNAQGQARDQLGSEQSAAAARATPEAGNAIAKAQSDSDSAARALNNGDFAKAMGSQKDALAALYKAQSSLQQKRQALAADLNSGEAPGEVDPTKLAEQLTTALEAVKSAASQDELRKLASQIGHTAASGGLSPPTQQALGAAQQALADAAAAPAEGQGMDEARSSAQQALAMARAQNELSSQGVMQVKVGGNVINTGANGSAYQAGSGDGAPGNVVASGGNVLPPRDRQILEQGSQDAYPPAYADMVEQYRRNLARER